MANQLAKVKTADDVRMNLVTFNQEAKRTKNKQRARSILRQTTYWVYDPDTRKFGPSKFVGYHRMDFSKYEACRNEQPSSGPAFDGAIARAFNEHAIGALPEANATLSRRLEIWGVGLAEKDVFNGVNHEWQFWTLPRLSPAHLPSWTRDELILALELYSRIPYNKISGSNPELIALSELLRSLPIHKFPIMPPKFRNPAGVHRKLGNFAHLDPLYSGDGLPASSKADAQVWKEFERKREALSLAAKEIRTRFAGNIAEAMLGNSEAALASDAVEGEEGRRVAKQHLVRERDPRLVRALHKRIVRDYGKLVCEACSFDFVATYGQRGVGYIECHHTVPVSSLKDGDKTQLVTLVGLCANCHRVIHRTPLIGLESLRNILKTSGHPQ